MIKHLVRSIYLTLFAGLLVVGFIDATPGCGTVAPIASDIIDCTKAEAITVSSGFSIVQIAAEVIAALKDGPTGVLATIEGLIKTYGADIVACAVDNYPDSAGAGSGSGSGTKLELPQDVLNKRLVMSTTFAGKKISHTGFKKPKS